MKGLKDYLSLQDDFVHIINGIKGEMREQLVSGLTNSLRNFLMVMAHESTNRPVVVVTPQLNQAQQLYDDLQGLTENPDQLYLYPINEMLPAEIMTASPELKSQRIEAKKRWQEKENGIFIVPVAGLKRLMPPKQTASDLSLTIETGKEYSLDDTMARLVTMGYKVTDMVSSPGEASKRGGIIDIYPLTNVYPIRIEWFDDEVESIRYFDVGSQRSIEELNQIEITATEEWIFTDEQMKKAGDKLEKLLQKSLKNIHSDQEKQQLNEQLSHDIERLKEGQPFDGIYQYLSLLYEDVYSLVDYFPKNSLFIFDEMSRITETAERLDREEATWHTDLLDQRMIVEDLTFSFTWEEVFEKIDHQRIYLSLFLRHIPNTKPDNLVNISSRQMQQFHGQMNLLKSEMKRWNKAGFSVIIYAADEERVDRVLRVLDDYGIAARVGIRPISVPLEEPVVLQGDLNEGFEMPAYKLAVLTAEEIFKKKKPKKRRRQKVSNAERIKSYQELNKGDYVVHNSHGIGKYLGIETLEVNGLHKDYMVVRYSGNDKLFVPTDQIDQVQKYVASEGKEPKLYRLGGSEWKKVKSRVKSSVEDIADDLIKLYAEREAAQGHQFGPDTEMQKDFEMAFPYQETEDQLRCIEEIKSDMEKTQPMDRLLCGDVGYGKTEVAIRAVFKAIVEGKQAAVLVPTTILAQQHFETFQERFKEFGVNVGLLSRFRTPKQQKETIDQLRKGLVDVVIGTHRVLSKDVVFKDLGLLIVDEEQRFGVKHKERIKQLKTNVDVLTLTATPIPRTLHMSMVGVRDLSVIETPPENRFPIQTYVVEYNPLLIRDAIERELARGGQVFFLYNRVDMIDRVAAQINELVEDARVVYAHGQMNERQLENIMLEFLEGEADVLVSTTIIETGVDIPNVNTLIVNDADKMGLSQLYQIRGRVGRSNRLAYAYFTYQQNKVLSEVAEKRLEAIKEFTELGSGFKIAMRDLSIRGAGNLLGTEQHGFIDSVGFDLYSQMLNDAVRAKQQGVSYEEAKPFEVEIGLDLDAYIPESYIQDEGQKIQMYKRIQALESIQETYDLNDELLDRFGEYPDEVGNLLQISRIRLHGKENKIESIHESKQKIECLMEAEQSQQIDGAKLFELANEYGRTIQLGTEGRQLKIVFQFSRQNKTIRHDQLEDFLSKLHQAKISSNNE